MAKHFITQKRTRILFIKSRTSRPTRDFLWPYRLRLRLRIMPLQSISNMMRNIQKVSFFQTKSRNRILTFVCQNKTKPEFSLCGGCWSVIFYHIEKYNLTCLSKQDKTRIFVLCVWFSLLRCVWWGFFGSSNLFGILRDFKVSFTLCSRLIRYVLNIMASYMSK